MPLLSMHGCDSLRASGGSFFAGFFSVQAVSTSGVSQGLAMNTCSIVRLSTIIAGTLFASTAGCGSKVPFDIVPVHGKVTYEDGSRIDADSILLTFNPVASGEKGKAVAPGGQTSVNVQDGTFSAVSSHRANDGVAVGKHKVVIVSFKKGANGSTAPSPAVPAIYRKESSTPLEIEVNSSDQFLDLKVKKN
jgi:hypothetical protein